MTESFQRHTQVLACLTLVLFAGILGCAKNGSSGASASGGRDGAPTSNSGNGGDASASGGTTSGTGGAGNGGATSGPGSTGTGGTTSGSGGGSANTGGILAGTGGRIAGTGGASSGAGGNNADAGPDTAGKRNDGPAGQDVPADAPQPKDNASDANLAQNDAPAADVPSVNPGDAGIIAPDGYKLVWSDEFNSDGTPDPKNWNYEKGFVRNSELQWYQANNATVGGGLLTIEGRREQVTNPNYVAGSSDWKTNRQYAQYTSTSMTTLGLQAWQYGRFELRAKIPTSAGMWPAWWTLGVSGEWPSNGEIDIMEYYKGNVLANVACSTATRWSAKWDSSTKAVSSLGASWSSSFHVWRMDWDDQNINLYLDDTLMNAVPLSSMLNSDGTSPFKQKVYMILNLAIGGDNGGDPSATTFPQQYQIDYVRVFQKL